ncbi:MAG TPA: hypothetical protein VJJ02_03940 [Candidatus Paceibacterota bacterium]
MAAVLSLVPVLRGPFEHIEPAKVQQDYRKELFWKLLGRVVTRKGDGRWLDASEICTVPRDVNAPTSCPLDFLITHPEIIPRELEDRVIFFHGKCHASGGDCIRYLYHENGKWDWAFWLGDGDGTQLPRTKSCEMSRKPQKLLTENETFWLQIEEWR